MKKIDIHAHVRDGKVPSYPGRKDTYATPEELRGMYDRLGIEKGVLLPGVNPESSIEVQSNNDAMRIVAQYSSLFYWFCNIDPRMGENSPDTDLSHFISFYKALGAKGVGEICANLYFDDPYLENLFYHCEKLSMPVTFHIGPKIGGCYGLVDEVGLPRLGKVLARFPKLKFLGHSQPFWAEIGADVSDENRNTYPPGKVVPGRLVELMSEYPNLCGDLSANSGYNALSRDPDFGYGFIEEFQDRLYFGADICSPEQERPLSLWLDEAQAMGRISEIAYRKVCRENALKLLEGEQV